MVIIFESANNLTVDTASCIITKGTSSAAGLPVVVGDGTAVQQVAGRSIASGNMNAMRWVEGSMLLIKSLSGITIAWVPFSTEGAAQDAIDAIGDALEATDPVIYISATGTAAVPS